MSRIVIDLRELLGADRSGIGALATWELERPWRPGVAALANVRAPDALRASGMADDALPPAS